MRDAVIVSTARTPIGRAYKGGFNATPGATLGSFSLAPAIERAGITGWTILPVSSGKGREGHWREESVRGTDKVFVLTIASEDKAMGLAEALAPMLSSLGLLLTMWDVQVIRGERF